MKEMNDSRPEARDVLAHLIEESRAFPVLTAEEEEALARRWRRHGDRDALSRLAGSHLRLVIKIARGYRGYGIPVTDLVGEGNLGLIKALEKFDPDRGIRLSTYAMWWIRAEIQEYILHTLSLVKMGTTAAQKKLFFNLRRLKNRLREPGEVGLSPDSITRIADLLGVRPSEVVEMDERLGAGDWSLNATISADNDGEWQDQLVDESVDQETRVVEADERAWRRRLLQRSLSCLDRRERHILVERRLKEDPKTLDELGRHYGVSRERVRQLEVRAFEKLQKEMLARGGAAEEIAAAA